MKRRRGLKGEPSPGVPPLRAAPAARSLCAPPWGWRWTKERVVEDADPYGGWETGRVPHNIPQDHPTPGRGPVERGGVGGDRSGGTSGTPSLTGRLLVVHISGTVNKRRARQTICPASKAQSAQIAIRPPRTAHRWKNSADSPPALWYNTTKPKGGLRDVIQH